MNRCLLLFALLPVLALAAPEKGSDVEKKKTQWDFTPNPSLPNVLILGDSISMGYTLDTRALLKGKANVFRPNENCSGTTKGVQAVDRWVADRKWAVIHFNFGLHDLKHVAKPGDDKASPNPQDPPQATVEKYTENLEVIVKKLKATGARLIFATTTPVPSGTKIRETGGEAPYNAAALKIMKANGIAINDLHAFCVPKLDKLQKPHDVHFTAAGSKALAEQVAKSIQAELKK
jgi:lysophospholipase L1-like esterase